MLCAVRTNVSESPVDINVTSDAAKAARLVVRSGTTLSSSGGLHQQTMSGVMIRGTPADHGRGKRSWR